MTKGRTIYALDATPRLVYAGHNERHKNNKRFNILPITAFLKMRIPFPSVQATVKQMMIVKVI